MKSSERCPGAEAPPAHLRADFANECSALRCALAELMKGECNAVMWLD